MNVLSLFDGISCGQLALQRAGVKVDNYFASEISENSIKVTMYNFPNTIQLGSVVNWEEWITNLPKIDLLIGGSPCQGLSRAKSGRLNLEDERSILFYKYCEILKYLKKENDDIKFLLENVVPDKETELIMNEEIGVNPIRINSNLFSAQNRDRFYWTNLEVKELPKENNLKIKDIIYDNGYKIKDLNDYDSNVFKSLKETKNYIKWDTSGKGHYSQANRAYYENVKMATVPKSRASSKLNIYLGNGKYRRIHPIECERLQTLPDDYTKIIETKNDDIRCGVIGDGWTVDVISHIFDSLK